MDGGMSADQQAKPLPRWNDAVVLMEGPIRLNRELMDRILRLLKQPKTDARE